eukprot:CAMPEP_0172690870 /NCGR_PEP_ID=MMETSP1074-20121228/24170_1 /TAXON_ID=2916 /ORGANISM="Ceratium fusus, Strain PA161109" /LENGTH=64 /DNA_ID=CAMNT_0013510873 /DNA_START=133 /DNA_END=327 /DNA_ORIENTATION=-
MVVMDLDMSHTWKEKKQVTTLPIKVASVQQNSTKNIVMNGVSPAVEDLAVSSIVHVMKWQSTAA